MSSPTFLLCRFALMLLFCLSVATGCSSSNTNDVQESSGAPLSGDNTGNDTGNSVPEPSNGSEGDPSGANGDDPAEGSDGSASNGSEGQTPGINGADSEPVMSDPSEQTSTRVNFDITVPEYVSNALQVGIVWGEKTLSARWVVDESWSASDDFPTNTQKPLIVTFYDDNGDITLASFETAFATGAGVSETVTITADQFDHARWDTDGDGTSNLDESVNGTSPLVDTALEPLQVNIEFIEDKTFRISWQSSPEASFYRILENPDGVSGFSQVGLDLSAMTTRFDHRVALYKRVNARYIVQACNANGCVNSDEQAVSGSLAGAIGYFKASNTSENDGFGRHITLSADGNTLAVGVPYEQSASVGINGVQDDDSSQWTGAVYVFSRLNGNWQEPTYLKASNAELADYFGASVSLSADGNTLAVGAYNEDSIARGVNGDQSDNSAYSPGAVYVFNRDGNNGRWQQHSYLKASNTVRTYGSAFFGYSVSLSADANTLVVGDIWEESVSTGINGNQFDFQGRSAGAAYVFVRTNDTWQQQAYVKASNTGNGDYFGASVSLSADGNTMAIGATRESSAAKGVNGDEGDNSMPYAGAVYVYARANVRWQQQAYVKHRNAAEGDSFGRSVSLSADGNSLAVGAYAVAAELFVRENGHWQQSAYFNTNPIGSDTRMGGVVSLSADGHTLAVGAVDSSAATGINGDATDSSAEASGSVFVFEHTEGTWQQKAYLKAGNTDAFDNFGSAVFLSGDGNTLAVGAGGEDSSATGTKGYQLDNSSNASGAVYLY